MLAMREVLEAAEAAQASALAPASLRQCQDDARSQLFTDPSLNVGVTRRAIDLATRNPIVWGSHGFAVLTDLLPCVESNYLSNWRDIVHTSKTMPSVERAARLIASHLLDSGCSAIYLHKWLLWRIKNESGVYSLTDLLTEAHDLLMQPLRNFECLIAITGGPFSRPGYKPDSWLSVKDVSAWLSANRSFKVPAGCAAGVRLTVKARDPWSAASLANEHIESLSIRLALGLRTELPIYPKLWISGIEQPFERVRQPITLDIGSLDRANKLYDINQESAVDHALNLIGNLRNKPSAVAVSSSWAAVEALLSAPGDDSKGTVAERFADIATCSFPRAELTSLAHAYRENNKFTNLGVALSMCNSNKASATILAETLCDGAYPTGLADKDDAGRERIHCILKTPETGLADVRAAIHRCMARLYRQRNIVNHWGRTSGKCLDAALRTAAPILSAGFDRIVHAWYVDRVSPRELAAIAALNLALLPDRPISAINELLER